MELFPTGSKKLNFTDTEEVISSDLNSLSAHVHQLIKDNNLNLFQNQQTGYSYPGCILGGCKVILTSGPTPTVQVSSGILMFALQNDPKNFSGSVVPILTPTTPRGTILLPSSGSENSYAIDIRYNEVVTPIVELRNIYSDVDKQINPQGVSVTTESSIDIILNPSDLKEGYTRLGTFTVNSGGTLSEFTYTLPFMWNLQTWPGLAHSPNLDTTKTLADSLSAIRAEVASILGPNAHWYDVPPINLTIAQTTISSMVSEINGKTPGIKTTHIYEYTGALQTLTIPAGISYAWIRAWAGGGNGGASNRSSDSLYSGGGGGAGGYVEYIAPVEPAGYIDITIPAWGVSPDWLIVDIMGATSGHLYRLRAGNGTNGGDWNGAAAGGIGGNAEAFERITNPFVLTPIPSTDVLCVPGKNGDIGGYTYNNDVLRSSPRSYWVLGLAAGGFSFCPWWRGHGGYAGGSAYGVPVNIGGPGEAGRPPLVLICLM